MRLLMEYTLNEIIELIEWSNYVHVKTIYHTNGNYKQYLVYTKLVPPINKAVIVLANHVLYKEYPVTDAINEEKLLDSIVERYHFLETNVLHAKDSVFYRTVFCAGGIALGALGNPMIPIVDDVILGICGYFIGRAVDNKDQKSRGYANNVLNDFLEQQGIFYDDDAVHYLRKEVENGSG